MVDFRKQVAGRPFILTELQAADLLSFDPSFLKGRLDVFPIFTGWVEAVYTDVEKGFEPGQQLQMQRGYLRQPEKMDPRRQVTAICFFRDRGEKDLSGIFGHRAKRLAGRPPQLIFQGTHLPVNPALADFHGIGGLAVGQPSLDHIRPVVFIFLKQSGQFLGELPAADFNIAARVSLGQSKIGVEGSQIR